MSARRTTIVRAVTLSATLLVLVVPSALAANPLLSGYGGPGQGAQVILGGGLVNPPGGGGSAPSSSPAGELTAKASETPSSGSVPSHGSAAHSPRGERAGPKQTSTSTTSGSQSGSAPAASTARSLTGSSGGTLGLSEGDALLIVFVLAGLAVTAILTGRLTHRSP